MTAIESLIHEVEQHRAADVTEERHRAWILSLLREVADPFSRSTWPPGHITASVYIVDPSSRQLLLHHHKRLDRWLQMGGHLEPGESPAEAALREGREESGLEDLRLLVPMPLDLDVHPIPAGKGEPDHFHFDVRYVGVTGQPSSIAFDAAESNALAWFSFEEAVAMMKSDESARVVRKIAMLLEGALDVPELLESAISPDPFVQFGRWYEAAQKSESMADAVALATSTCEGGVSLRMVLLKGFDEHGFVFFTNYNSRKSEQIRVNPNVALCFHWHSLERQVRIEGACVRVTEEESDAYFATRPRGSQLGAWASEQSKVIMGRGDLEARMHELEHCYADRPIPRPPHWGGYRVIPVLLEFWQGRPDRLHDRIVYRLREPKDWTIERLSP